MKCVVTGACGFIGSHLVSALLRDGHDVIAVDNLWTGHTDNLYQAIQEAGPHAASRIQYFETDVRDFCGYSHADVVFHLAALGSVPRSLERPLQTYQANADGFFMMLNRARKQGARRIVYASSSSVYGDDMPSPEGHIEPMISSRLSPYAATKRLNEVLAESFSHSYGTECVGLRFFNVYGPRQNPNGPYAAVIPRWISAMKKNEPIQIYGDGEQTRDFTYVKDVVQALLKAANIVPVMLKLTSVYNVGSATAITLNFLFQVMKELTGYKLDPEYLRERPGDRKHSKACLDVVRYSLGYEPEYLIQKGLEEMIRYAQGTKGD